MSEHQGWGRRLRRLAVAAVAFTSIALDYHGSPEQYFTYFTILTNLSIGTWFLAAALAGGRLDRASALRLALTVYGLVTLTVYWVFLSPTHHPQGWSIPANFGLHLVVPLAMALEDLLVPWPRLSRLAPLWCLIFPLAYCAFSLTRGELTGWYPYFFLDKAKLGGWLGLTAFVLFLFAVFLALAYGWRLAIHLRHGRVEKTTAP
jgi:hypothetical protein